MAKANEENTADVTGAEAPAKAKRTQLSATFSPEELQRIDDASWIGRHRKLSEFMHTAAIRYAEHLESK